VCIDPLQLLGVPMLSYGLVLEDFWICNDAV